ncbi:sensor histidine kinase [Staphylospora marina]|uniref:sensor histidine kinase n=1 Tax=Staphylospora marina TaxID=2490858 RepID=UPI000F5BADCC|nr:histidine kinase [Staphylospora marina]
MRYQQIKWMILLTPTVLVGAWEYVRHEFLLPWLSMEAGNWLTPVLVFLATVTLLRKLFLVYEEMQEELRREKARQAVFEERERIARELHDGIAQTLFLMSIQIDELKQKHPGREWPELERNLRQVHDNVRQAIFNLKPVREEADEKWSERVRKWVLEFETDTGIRTVTDIRLDESLLSPKEKAELFACIQEALTNVRKHAEARRARVELSGERQRWVLRVTDDGKGLKPEAMNKKNRFGLNIMRDRARLLGATLRLWREEAHTVLEIRKEGKE